MTGLKGEMIAAARLTCDDSLRYLGRPQKMRLPCGHYKVGWLARECAKVREMLSIKPKWPLAETVRRTMVWYRAQYSGAGAPFLADTAYYEKADGNIST